MYDYNIAGRETGAASGLGGGADVMVNMPAMIEFASALQRNVDDDYVPAAQYVFNNMSVQPEGQPSFVEIWSALEQHDQVKMTATDNVANFANGAKVFANAAQEISRRYRETDAFAAARLTDVQQHLGTTPEPPPAGTTPPPAGTDPATNPAEGV